MFRTRPALLPLAVSAALLGSLLACSRQADTPAPATAPTEQAPQGPKAALGSFGFDTAGMDKAVAPGDDFFQYANGGWVKNTEIPPDRSSFNSFTTILQDTEQHVRQIIEGAAGDAKASGDLRKAGDYYAAFMDEAGIQARGLAPVEGELKALSEIADKRALAATLGGQLRADVDLLNATDLTTDRLFGVWISQDLHQPDRVTPYLVQGGLGMPERSFYLEGGRMAELRRQYQAHVAKVLELGGIADAQAKAARVLALEIEIAKVHATNEQTQDVRAGANAWRRADLDQRAPGLDWQAFLEAAGLQDQQDFIAWQPGAISGISALVDSQPLDTWKDYLVFHALDRASPFLPKALADESFEFYSKTLNGVPQQRERWKRAVSLTNEALGEAVGKQYVAQYFKPETKARAEAMVKNIVAAFAARIDGLDWMSPETKQEAKAKIAGLKVEVGYPSAWTDYAALEVKRDDPLGNAERAGRLAYEQQRAKLGKPVGHSEWYMLPQTVNALNVPLENRLIFPAAILQPPFFDPNADEAVNYGAIGAVIGHEISHSFDNMGAQFDARGALRNWWTPQDLERFDAAGAALAAQFSQYKAFDDLAVNGKLTLGENIADVAGLATAHDAYRLSQQGKPAQALEGFSPEQRFFLGFAQAWRGKYREAALRNAILTDVHAPGQFRAQTVRNLDAWYDAFGVQPDQKLYLAPAQRVKVW
ncbi:M13 family metallopeptidase [Pseudoxanthomonas composti]|uniref:M13 family peptidase n=1 Tax=Pseudoxanthomonas composti TaxID=2137479 RepID=A0A4V1N0M5_9GAMM|nr:M13 family metallopeptidase [Pseudoxanthomonas composti]RXQ98910.1 M13 family peptidase [Pseudoxanthomonas composti]